MLGESPKDLNSLSLMVSGAVSGVLCWTISMPQDIIKTNVQLDFNGSKYPRHKYIPDGGFISCAKDLIRTEGIRSMFKGFVPQTYQAIIGNAFMFLSYEKFKSFVV